MKYVIHKTSRSPTDISYTGSTWDVGSIRRLYQDTYDDLAVAESIAAMLSMHNPVGFAVSPAQKPYVVVYKKKGEPGLAHYTTFAEHKDAARQIFLDLKIPHDHIVKVIR
jgi:hypothetical protein